MTQTSAFKNFFRKAGGFFFPKEIQPRVFLLFFLCIFFKFILFDLIWCLQTTFSSFSTAECYLNKIWVSLILMLPFVCFRSSKTTVVICFILDGLLISNLLYFRTYYTAIPLDSYLLAGNLNDFTASVFDSIRWTDMYFPLSTIVAIVIYRKKYKKSNQPDWRRKRLTCIGHYLLLLLLSSLLSGLLLWNKGGIKPAFESLQNANYHTCGVPMYTLFGNMFYEHQQEKTTYTPETGKEIENWLRSKPAHKPVPFKIEQRDNCIVILCESLESWVLEREYEGKEITPNLNALLKETNTLYAPNVLTQVKGGRSIDAQLLLYTGLLPITNGAYSTKYPDSYYPSLIKAFKEWGKGKTYSMTVDKQITWNQNIVARAFGIDSLIAKEGFVLDEKVGLKKKLGDVSFLRQVGEKITPETLWPANGHTFLQCVTYSGHNPFILPDELKRIDFTGNMPERMRDYMIMANYTDHAIGSFIKTLRSQEKFAHTMIVITGDHEGLAGDREELCKSKAGKGVVSEGLFTPFIVINSPIGMRYDKVMGQVDMYPTLLNLLQLDSYKWTGMGQSILDPDKKGFAINPQLQVIGDTEGVSEEEIEHAKEAWKISDMIIKFDYLNSFDSTK